MTGPAQDDAALREQRTRVAASEAGDAERRMSIGELAVRTGVSVRSLRYYEQQGLLLPERTHGGRRIYSDADERTLHQIRELFRAGFCSSVIRDLLAPLSCPSRTQALLSDAFDAARQRLEREREAIDGQLQALADLQRRTSGGPDEQGLVPSAPRSTCS